MTKLVLYVSMSLDGFIAGPNDDERHPLGQKGHRLHDWLRDGGIDPVSHRPTAGPSRQVFDEAMETGAVIAGRRTFDLAGGWDGDHHDGVPIFVPTHRTPPEPPRGTVHYVTDGIESCVAQAKAAAGERDVMLHGAYTAQQCLKAGLLDQMEIHLIPVVLGGGRPLFATVGPEHTELTLLRALEAPDVLHLRYQVTDRSRRGTE